MCVLDCIILSLFLSYPSRILLHPEANTFVTVQPFTVLRVKPLSALLSSQISIYFHLRLSWTAGLISFSFYHCMSENTINFMNSNGQIPYWPNLHVLMGFAASTKSWAELLQQIPYSSFITFHGRCQIVRPVRGV